MTGSADGVVRMWSLDYVEIPVGGTDTNAGGTVDSKDDDLDDALSEQSGSIAAFAKKMSMSMSGDCLNSLREAIAQTRNSAGGGAAGSANSEPSSDTEEGDDLETEDETDRAASTPPLQSDAAQDEQEMKDDDERSQATPTALSSKDDEARSTMNFSNTPGKTKKSSEKFRSSRHSFPHSNSPWK